MGVEMRVLPPQAESYIVAGALLSIAVNPLVFRLLTGSRVAIAQSAAKCS
jgi:predicted Kef-type K+ transport protein